jgi:hypothetical protein
MLQDLSPWVFDPESSSVLKPTITPVKWTCPGATSTVKKNAFEETVQSDKEDERKLKQFTKAGSSTNREIDLRGNAGPSGP